MNAHTPPGPGGPPLPPQALDRIARMLRKDAGIEIPEGKASLVQARLSRRLREIGLQDYRAYCDLLESPDGAAERKEMLSALTTNVTKFFREIHHFDALRKEILPPLMERARQGKAVRFWSAGCSSGEEPYSLAMTILETDPRASEYNVKILATDIDPRILQRARAGIYPARSIAPPGAEFANKYVTKHGADQVEMNDQLKKMVTFNRLNLHDSWPFQGKFDHIFCRNVVIYFAKDNETAIWRRMIDRLQPEGLLMVGHSERVPLDCGLPVTLDGVTTYRKTSAI